MRKGSHHSEETRAMMSEAKQGENHPFYGKHHSEETKSRISEARLRRKRRLGYLNSPETRSKISASLKGKPSWNKGMELSEEHKSNLSMANRGQHSSPATEFKKGNIPWFKGLPKERHPNYGKHHSAKTRRKISEAKMGGHHTEETRRKISEAVKGKNTGENNPRWKGGYDPYYGPDWLSQRRLARKRDDYTCLCGSRENGRELDVHHLIPYNSCFNNCLGNLTTLCSSCHQFIEHRFPIEMPKVKI